MKQPGNVGRFTRLSSAVTDACAGVKLVQAITLMLNMVVGGMQQPKNVKIKRSTKGKPQPWFQR